jgi:DNA-binding MarR family transcriptional regulator
MTTQLNSIAPGLEFCLRLAKAHAAVVRRFDRRLGAFHGIGFGDFVVLWHLGNEPQGKLRGVDLAEKVGLTASAVTRILIPLEKIGLVARQPDPRDARVSYAALTAAGRRILKESVETAELIAQDAIGADPVPRLAAASEVLARLGSS